LGTESNDHPPEAPPSARFAGLRRVSLLTLSSRLLGLLRDMLMASRFGNGPLLDAFTVAFRIPNLARRLFGEGALSTSFLPALVGELEREGRTAAWRLATAVFYCLAGVLGLLVLLGELLLAAGWIAFPAEHPARLLIAMTAVMLPYLLLICLAAQLGTVFHALGRFGWPAFSPVVLNVVWIAALLAMRRSGWPPDRQIFAVCWTVLFAGGAQLLIPILLLAAGGIRFQSDWTADRHKVRGIAATMFPIVIGMSVTQLNALFDSLIAWGLSSETPDESGLGNLLESGTAAALYLGQRLYQFPIGVFGVALGTVLFPLFSRHVEQDRRDLLQADYLSGMKLVLAIGLPAGVGLMLASEPLAAVLFQRGAFDADDTRQTARMISAYGLGVWAFCGLLIVNRAFYALRDHRTPLRLGLFAMGVNLLLNLCLIWPLGGAGLATATSLASVAQVLASISRMKRHLPDLRHAALGECLLKSIAVTAAMCGGYLAGDRLLPDRLPAWAGLAASIALAVASYLLACRLLRLKEPFALLRGKLN
jgi:putative peptidoglycan lipid II flippase